MTTGRPAEPLELRQQLAFLLLSVEADPHHAMAPFLDWCLQNREAIRSLA